MLEEPPIVCVHGQAQCGRPEHQWYGRRPARLDGGRSGACHQEPLTTQSGVAGWDILQWSEKRVQHPGALRHQGPRGVRIRPTSVLLEALDPVLQNHESAVVIRRRVRHEQQHELGQHRAQLFAHLVRILGAAAAVLQGGRAQDSLHQAPEHDSSGRPGGETFQQWREHDGTQEKAPAMATKGASL